MSKVFNLVTDRYIDAYAVAGADLVIGEAVQIDSCAAFTMADVTSGDAYAAVVYAEKVRAKKVSSTEVIAVGADLWWNHAAKAVTATKGALTVYLGYCLRASANGDTDVLMTFEGRGITLA